MSEELQHIPERKIGKFYIRRVASNGAIDYGHFSGSEIPIEFETLSNELVASYSKELPQVLRKHHIDETSESKRLKLISSGSMIVSYPVVDAVEIRISFYGIEVFPHYPSTNNQRDKGIRQAYLDFLKTFDKALEETSTIVEKSTQTQT